MYVSEVKRAGETGCDAARGREVMVKGVGRRKQERGDVDLGAPIKTLLTPQVKLDGP